MATSPQHTAKAQAAGNSQYHTLPAPPTRARASQQPGVSLQGRTGEHGSASHWCALSTTVLPAVCAFVLPFDALHDLAIRSGIRTQPAWPWPIAVDVTIAQSTVAGLSLSRATTTAPALAAAGWTVAALQIA